MSNLHDPSESNQEFSWERWLLQGLSALRRSFFRYDFGLPEAFWQHMENASRELLAAARILVRALLTRDKGSGAPPRERGPIDIDWD